MSLPPPPRLVPVWRGHGTVWQASVPRTLTPPGAKREVRVGPHNQHIHTHTPTHRPRKTASFYCTVESVENTHTAPQCEDGMERRWWHTQSTTLTLLLIQSGSSFRVCVCVCVCVCVSLIERRHRDKRRPLAGAINTVKRGWWDPGEEVLISCLVPILDLSLSLYPSTVRVTLFAVSWLVVVARGKWKTRATSVAIQRKSLKEIIAHKSTNKRKSNLPINQSIDQ